MVYPEQQNQKELIKLAPYQTIDAHKLLRALGPRWQLHVGDDCAVLHHPQVVIVGVDKHLRKVEELGDQFLQGPRTQSQGETCSLTLPVFIPPFKRLRRSKALEFNAERRNRPLAPARRLMWRVKRFKLWNWICARTEVDAEAISYLKKKNVTRLFYKSDFDGNLISACLSASGVCVVGFPKNLQSSLGSASRRFPVFSLDLFGFERQKRGFLQQVGQILS